jgi:hypothetical protein
MPGGGGMICHYFTGLAAELERTPHAPREGRAVIRAHTERKEHNIN